MAAVVAAPTPTPTSLLFEVLANSFFSFLLPSASRFELIIVQAIKKIPTPAIKVSTEVAICTPSTVICSPIIDKMIAVFCKKFRREFVIKT